MGQIVKHRWGAENIVFNAPDYCLKFLHVLRGMRAGRHRHPVKHKTFYCTAGAVMVKFDDHRVMMSQGDVVDIPPGTWHSFCGVDEQNVLIEVGTHDDPFDCHRDPTQLSGPVTQSEAEKK